jgi:hypothetical protein
MVDSDLIFGKEITIYPEGSQFIFNKSNNPNVFISMNKETMKIRQMSQFSPKIGTGVNVYSILGILYGTTNYYLLGVSKAKFIGYILNSRVFKIEELTFLSSMSNDVNNIIPEEDQKYLMMIREFLNRNNLYFSDTLDLSVNMQNIFTNNSNKYPGKRDSYIFNDNTVPQFCWNYNMSLELDSVELKGFVSIVINGFVGIRNVSDYSEEFNYIIISRKDTRRSGMRFLVRGNDKNGFAANYVETEHIVVEKKRNENTKTNLLSYIQVRGSIPFMWTQCPNLQLNPKIALNDDYSENVNSFRKHVTEMKDNYGRVILINLIDKKKDQKIIGEYFQNLSKEAKENKSKENINFII